MSRSRSFKVEEDVSMTEKTEEKSLLREVWDALSFSEIRTAMRVALKHMFVSCAARFDSIPPGIWEIRISESTPAKSLSNWWYFLRAMRRTSAMGGSVCRSRRVS